MRPSIGNITTALVVAWLVLLLCVGGGFSSESIFVNRVVLIVGCLALAVRFIFYSDSDTPIEKCSVVVHIVAIMLAFLFLSYCGDKAKWRELGFRGVVESKTVTSNHSIVGIKLKNNPKVYMDRFHLCKDVKVGEYVIKIKGAMKIQTKVK